MDFRALSGVLVTLSASAGLAAQAPVDEVPVIEDADEIIVVGQQRRMELRIDMLAAEKNVYDLFNKFNDEPRFEISCSMHAKTGSRLETQFCIPAFKREALAAEGKDYLDAYRAYLDPNGLDYQPNTWALPAEAVIKRGEIDYQEKMQQVAREQPEFLEALIRYTEMKAEYEAATSMAGAAAATE